MKPIKLTKTEFIQKIGNVEAAPKDWKYVGDKPCIVDFQAPWCGYCKRLDPILEEFAQTYEGRLDIYKVNVDKEEDLETLFNIRTIPTLLICKTDGTKTHAGNYAQTRVEEDHRRENSVKSLL